MLQENNVNQLNGKKVYHIYNENDTITIDSSLK